MLFLLLPGLLGGGLSPAHAQQTRSNAPTEADIAAVKAPPAPSALLTQQALLFLLNRPSSVRRYFVTCTGSTELDVAVSDFGTPGDHWQAKVKAWDTMPNTAVATAPGTVNVFSAPARVFNYGGTPANRNLTALIEVSYLHGVNVFPLPDGAGGFMIVTSAGPCTIEDLGIEDRIDRTP
jgi:hypothetical protein